MLCNSPCSMPSAHIENVNIMQKHKKSSSLNTYLLFSQKYMFWSFMFIRDFQQLLEYCFIHQEIRDSIHTLSSPWINSNKFHLNLHFSFKTCTKPYIVDNGGKKLYSLFSLFLLKFSFIKICFFSPLKDKQVLKSLELRVSVSPGP